jgi:GT2 family glycosyltransferase
MEPRSAQQIAWDQLSKQAYMAKSQNHTDVAVLMTCHNRRETTLRCLLALAKQQLPAGARLRVLLTDDGSTDGTGEAVGREFPNVAILRGDGSLYWGGGTTMAWNAARPADFYLWLNDDVTLRPGALRQLFDVYQSSRDPKTIVVGSTCDPDAGKTCTGGMRRKSWHNVSIMDPVDGVQSCDGFNGNIVLIPRVVDELVSGLDPSYTHFFADADYGMRARKQGVTLLVAPGYLGECRLNSLAGTSFDKSLSIAERWRKMFGPKGYRPPREWWAFVRSHAPRPKWLYWLIPYALFALESFVGGRLRLRRDVKVPMRSSGGKPRRSVA